MTVVIDSHDRPPAPTQELEVAQVDAALFYSGLVAFGALLAFGVLTLMAVLPAIIPGFRSASITSASMTPTLRVGDVVLGVDHHGTEISPNTVVMYEDPRRHDLVTHRVVSTTADGAHVTRGDRSGIDDPSPIPAANIRARAKWVVPMVGLPRVWLEQRQWANLNLFVGGLAMAIWLCQFALDPRHDPWRERAGSDTEVRS